MKEITDDKQRHKIRARIEQIESEIKSEHEFMEFGASREYEYRMCDARIDGLRSEKRELERMLGFHHFQVIGHDGREMGIVKGTNHYGAYELAVDRYGFEPANLEPVDY